MAFIGSYDHAPNLDASRWLIDEIMPLVRKRDPSIECLLVGSDMPDQLRHVGFAKKVSSRSVTSKI